MAKSAIAGLNKTARRLEKTKNDLLKKAEAKKIVDKKKADNEKLKKDIEKLRKK